MSIAGQAFKGASWLALFKLLSQIFSWTITIVIARILLPEEYGLYAMALLITGYAELFSRLGLGSAIIQKQNITDTEMSSIFWFSIMIGTVFSIACFPIAYISSYIFN
jgi:O-antigen/teichoic acid export membrane protein